MLSNVQEQLNITLQALRDGDYERAYKLINNRLSQEPEDSSAIFLSGVALIGMNLIESAITQFEKAAPFQSKNPILFFNLGSALRQVKRYNDAIINLERAYALQPDDNNIARALADCYVKVKKFSTSQDYLY